MRLLNTSNLQLKLFMPEVAPDYVILSHRWYSEEVIFDDFAADGFILQRHPARSKAGYQKVLGACKRALEDHYEWIWIDSCCIDRSSSAVLQESINSMWRYYANANICYAYMSDVQDQEAGWQKPFLDSEWFDRGWTLQELVAPAIVEFYARDWSPIGTKMQRCDQISARTWIPEGVLLDPDEVEAASIANRMSWAAHRRVTREEDQAYCLLGLFRVAMPMLYGEGAAKAFGRLQEATYNSTRDDSLFLFRYALNSQRLPLLAVSPTQFCPRPACLACDSSGYKCLPSDTNFPDIVASGAWAKQAHELLLTTVTLTRFEASTNLLLLGKSAFPRKLLQGNTTKELEDVTHLAILNQTLRQSPEGALCLLLHRSTTGLWTHATRRIRAYPVLIPDWTRLIAKTREMKVLVASSMVSSYAETSTKMELLVAKGPYYAWRWQPQEISPEVLLSPFRRGTSYIMHSPGLQQQPREILCHIIKTADAEFGLTLTLQRRQKIWLISEARLPKDSKSEHSPLARPQDRCVLKLSSDESLLISVRRMPVNTQQSSGDNDLHIKTQIQLSIIK